MTFYVEIFLILALILLNGLFALAEMALVSARKVRLQQQAEAGRSGAQAALALAENPTRFLSTVQIGITLIGTLNAAVAGATLSEYLAAWLQQTPRLAPYAEALSVGLVVLAITYLSLVFGELVPKRLALNNAEGIAMRIAGPMQTLSRLVSPLVSLLSVSTRGVLRLLGVKKSQAPAITEEEVKILLQEGAQSGIFEAVEHDILKRVLRLGDRRVSTMMTYRKDVDFLDLDDDPDRLEAAILQAAHARLPVARGGPDQVVGVLPVKSYLARRATGSTAQELLANPDRLRDLLEEALFVPETLNGLEMLERFKETPTNVALVVDEYGGFLGLLTANDVLEALIGSLPETGEGGDPQIVRRADGSWLLDGRLTIEEAKELLDLRELPGEEDGDYETLGGLMMQQLERIPRSGDAFDWQGRRFEVMDMDGYRVDKVLVSPLLDDAAKQQESA